MAGPNTDHTALIIRPKDNPPIFSHDRLNRYPDENRDFRSYASPQPCIPHFARPVVLVEAGSLLGFPHHHHCVEETVPWVDSREQEFFFPFDFDQTSLGTPRVITGQSWYESIEHSTNKVVLTGLNRAQDAPARSHRWPRFSGRVRALFENHNEGDPEVKENGPRRTRGSQATSAEYRFDNIGSQILDQDEDSITIRLPRRTLTQNDGFTRSRTWIEGDDRAWVDDEGDMCNGDRWPSCSVRRHCMIPSERFAR